MWIEPYRYKDYGIVALDMQNMRMLMFADVDGYTIERAEQGCHSRSFFLEHDGGRLSRMSHELTGLHKFGMHCTLNFEEGTTSSFMVALSEGESILPARKVRS